MTVPTSVPDGEALAAFIHALLGPPPNEDCVIYTASNTAPARGTGAGSWRERTHVTAPDAAAELVRSRDAGCTYIAAAWFASGQGAKRVAVRARRWIAADVDPKEMPGSTFEERREQARRLADSVPVPHILVDSGYGFHVYVLLPEALRYEAFLDHEDGLRSVEVLGRALRLWLEAEGGRRFGAPIGLDSCHGAQRVWRVPGGWNAKAGDGAKELTGDRSAWAGVSLVRPAATADIEEIEPADLEFLHPFVEAAEQEHDGGSASTAAATLDQREPGSQGSGETSVAVAGGAAFDTNMLTPRLREQWPMRDGDQSAHDFAVAAELASAGWGPETCAAAIRLRRSALATVADREKADRAGYVQRTVLAAQRAAAPKRASRPQLERIPFPVRALPAVIGAFLTQAANALRCALEAIAVPLLTAAGAAIGTSRSVRLKRTWYEPPLLWSVLVQPSGSVKSPALDLATAPLRARQRKLLDEFRQALDAHALEHARWKKQLAAWRRAKGEGDPPAEPERPTAERCIVSDTTLEGLISILNENPRGLLLIRDELGAWLKSFDAYRQGRGGDQEQWLSMHRAGSVLVDRKIGRQILSVDHAFVAITGGIQPRALARVLTPDYFECGMSARILFSMPEAPQRVWTEDELDEALSERVAAAFDRLRTLRGRQGGSGGPTALTLDPEAHALWIDVFNAIAREQGRLETDDMMRMALSKLEAYIPRFALILTLLDWALSETEAPPIFIPAWAMRGAIDLVRHFTREADRVYAMFGESAAAREDRSLVEWITRHGGRATVRDLCLGPRRFRGNAETAHTALEGLVEKGTAFRELMAPPSGGGHSQIVYVLRGEPRTRPTSPGDGDTRSLKGLTNGHVEDRVSPGGEDEETDDDEWGDV